jgi:hypothetical protein
VCIEQGYDFDIATSYNEAISKFKGPYDVICLDHDLGGMSYVNSGEYNTGYNFCKWLPGNTTNPTVFIHSYNPDGAENMRNLLSEKGYSPAKIPFGPTLLSILKGM